MQREPDWETLAEINFLLYRRMSEHLNAALAAVSIISSPEGDVEKEAGFWEDRTTVQLLDALNLHNAWASLVRHKMGETFLPQHMRQFHATDLLQWLARQLQLEHIPAPENDLLLSGNRETLQEALLLLRSSAYTLGPDVGLYAQSQPDGIWFRIRYAATGEELPESIDELLEKLPDNWRAQGAAFEITRALDFLAMNDCELVYTVKGGRCELGFFIPAVASQQPDATAGRAGLGNIDADMSAADFKAVDPTTKILPEEE